MYEVGNLVTLKTADQYDRKTLITKDEIGEIVDIAVGGGPTRFVVAMQDMVDEEGVTPMLWKTYSELDFYQT